MFEPVFVEGCDPLFAVLQDVERAAAGVFVRQCEVLLELWDTAPADTKVGDRPQLLAEAGMALRLHPLSVDARLRVAETLRDHPLLRGLLVGGRLGVAHVMAVVDELAELTDPDPAEPTAPDPDPDGLGARVLTDVLATGGRLGWPGTPAELRRAVRRAVVRLDPAAAARRRAAAAGARTGVRLRPLPDGLAGWVATGPAGQLGAADRILDVLSHPTGPDDTRSHGQRQIDALLAALAARAGTTTGLELHLALPVQVTATTDLGPSCPPEPLILALDLTPDLLALLTDSPDTDTADTDDTDTDTDDTEVEPAEVEPLDVEPAKVEATDVEPLDVEPAKVEPADVEPLDVEAAVPPPAGQAVGRRLRDGVPELLGMGPVDAGLLTDLLTDPAGLPVGLGPLQVRRVCVDPTGQVVAVDPTAVPLAQLLTPPTSTRRAGTSTSGAGIADPGPGATSTADPGPGATSAAALLARLSSGLPAPPPVTDAYAPTAAQTRLVRARDSTCRFPGCARRAHRTELDHRVPYPAGPTSVSNLQPLCKHHHRLKHDGWTSHRDPDGTTTWTSPRGQHRTVPAG